jgi:hypothetical protein
MLRFAPRGLGSYSTFVSEVEMQRRLTGIIDGARASSPQLVVNILSKLFTFVGEIINQLLDVSKHALNVSGAMRVLSWVKF